DDDDAVSPAYIPTILGAIDCAPGVDVVLIRGERLDDGKKVWEFTYDVRGQWFGAVAGRERGAWVGGGDGTIMCNSPDHLCPVRTDIARAAPFEDRRINEDVEWARAVAPRLRSSARTEGVLYTYRTKAGREWERRE
ncbi:MAG: hypothetical protein KGK07_15130, partial [Chloroflexota bacterium]|nr:hypothetical protein [Chloroflexota bacterium]